MTSASRADPDHRRHFDLADIISVSTMTHAVFRVRFLATVHTCIGDRVGLYGGSCRLVFAISIRR
ncbi:MAG: hypothetical protein OXD33_09315, partial [Rhodobacteraceae bacterium]|nr:hypothetical protein [Paracoccaceae bacterium]